MARGKWLNPRTECKQGHPLTEENTYYHPTRHYRSCRQCRDTASRDWQSRNKEHVNRGKRFRRYGISEADFLMMLVLQDSKCLICEKDFMENTIHIDHSPVTSHVRGLLCPNCNSGLGKFLDNSDLLLKAAEYVEAN